MGAEILSTPLIIVIAVAALGVYLMLPLGNEVPGRKGYWTGVVLFSLPVMLLGFSLLELVAVPIVFSILACVSLAAALMTVTSRTATTAIFSFSLVLLSNAGLYLIGSAWLVSFVTLIVYMGIIAASYLFVARAMEVRDMRRIDSVAREPFLACVSGALLAITVVGVIQYALTVEAKPRFGSARSSALPKRTTVEAFLRHVPTRMRIDGNASHVKSLARTLYRDHFVAIGVAILLIVPVLVAYVVRVRRTTARTDEPRNRQDSSTDPSRTPRNF